MNTLRNDLINKIKKMPEEYLRFINQAISSISNLSKPDDAELKAAFKGYLDDIYKSLFVDSMQNSYFTNQSLKTCNLLDL